MQEYQEKKDNYNQNENPRYNTISICFAPKYENSNKIIYNNYQNQQGNKPVETITTNSYNIPENSKMLEILSKINLEALPKPTLVSNSTARFRFLKDKSNENKYKYQYLQNRNINIPNPNTENLKKKSKCIKTINSYENTNFKNNNSQKIINNVISNQKSEKNFNDKNEKYNNENYFKIKSKDIPLIKVKKSQEINDTNEKINNKFRYQNEYYNISNRNFKINNKKSPFNTKNTYHHIIKLQSFWRGYRFRQKQIIKLHNITKAFLTLESIMANIFYKLRKYTLLELLSILRENLIKSKESENQKKQMQYKYRKKTAYNDDIFINAYNEYNSEEEKKTKKVNMNNENLLYRTKKINFVDKEKEINSPRVIKNLDSNTSEKCFMYNTEKNQNGKNKNYDLSSDNKQLKKIPCNKINFKYVSNTEIYQPKKKKIIKSNSKNDNNNKNDFLYKKLKFEEFFDVIRKRCYFIYYSKLKENLIKLGKENLMKKKIDVLKKRIKIINNKILKRYFINYKEKILIEKIKEQLLNKKRENDKANQIKTNISDNNFLKSMDKFENNIINNSENLGYKKINNDIDSSSNKRKIDVQNKFNAISVNRINSSNINYSKNKIPIAPNISNNNFDFNKSTSSNIKNENSFVKRTHKKYLRIKYGKKSNFTSKSKCSVESFGQSDISPKKMKIKNIVINTPNQYFFTYINNNVNNKLVKEKIKFVDNNLAKKLFSIVKKIENKNTLNKFFGDWKKCCKTSKKLIKK